MRILLVEDDRKISAYLANGLQQAGYAVDCAYEGDEGRQFLETYSYSLVILDIMLPKIDGLSLLEKLRHRKLTVPVLILSAKHTVDDRVKGLQLGGDDYLTKPFSFSELLARVQALLRRSEPLALGTTSPTMLEAGDISINLLTRQVLRNNRKIDLQTKEFALLEYFSRNVGQVLSKTQILDCVWNYQFDPQTNVVDVLVCRLRGKLDKDFEKKTIQTIRGVGYVFQPN